MKAYQKRGYVFKRPDDPVLVDILTRLLEFGDKISLLAIVPIDE